METESSQDVLYHGSRHKIEDFLEPRQATDKSNKDNSLNGVYSTDRFECAAGMSLTGEQWACADYKEKDFKMIFIKEPPTQYKERYVYELPKKYFTETGFKHQYISTEKVPILKTHVFKTEELEKYWRMATDKERDVQIEKMEKLKSI